jgi:hypothetical protein
LQIARTVLVARDVICYRMRNGKKIGLVGLVLALGVLGLVGTRALRPRGATLPPPPFEKIAVRLPVGGGGPWLPEGTLFVPRPRGAALLWNPDTAELAPTKPLPVPPLPRAQRGNFSWFPSPDGKWFLVEQTRYEPHENSSVAWPVAQRTWLLPTTGPFLGEPNPAFQPQESPPLWLPDSSGWVTASHKALIWRERDGRRTSLPLPSLDKEHCGRWPVAVLPDGNVVVGELCVEPMKGIEEPNPIERLQFRTAARSPKPHVSEPTVFPFLLSSGTELVAPVFVSVSPDGKQLVVEYRVCTVAPAQAFWGRFIAGPEPRNLHMELWSSTLEGGEARCLFKGLQFFSLDAWHPDSKRLLVTTSEAAYILSNVP